MCLFTSPAFAGYSSAESERTFHRFWYPDSAVCDLCSWLLTMATAWYRMPAVQPSPPVFVTYDVTVSRCPATSSALVCFQSVTLQRRNLRGDPSLADRWLGPVSTNTPNSMYATQRKSWNHVLIFALRCIAYLCKRALMLAINTQLAHRHRQLINKMWPLSRQTATRRRSCQSPPWTRLKLSDGLGCSQTDYCFNAMTHITTVCRLASRWSYKIWRWSKTITFMYAFIDFFYLGLVCIINLDYVHCLGCHS